MATGYISSLTPGAAVFPDGSAGNVACGLSRIQGTASNPKPHFLALDFDGAGVVPEHAQWTFKMPGNYASGGTLTIDWIMNGTSNAVKWQARVSAVTPADADTPVEHAFAAAATVTTNVNTTEANRLTTSAITLTMDSAAPGDWVTILLLRDPADAADTSTVDARVLVCEFSYTTT